MSRAWVGELDEQHDVFYHGVSGSDLDSLITYCKEAGDAHHMRGDMKHVARVEQTVIMDWCNKQGVTFSQFMRDNALIDRFLNDPANVPFRVWKGRV
jgi:hypothetical protein